MTAAERCAVLRVRLAAARARVHELEGELVRAELDAADERDAVTWDEVDA